MMNKHITKANIPTKSIFLKQDKLIAHGCGAIDAKENTGKNHFKKEKKNKFFGIEKKVHFYDNNDSHSIIEETIGYVSSLEDMTVEDTNMIWWGEDDLNSFKESVQKIAISLREDERVRKCLGAAMKASSGTRDHSLWKRKYKKQYGIDSENEWNMGQLNEKTGSNAFLGLVDWCRNHGDRRGLEKWSCYDHYNEREKLYIDSLEAVLFEQRRQRLNDKKDYGPRALEDARLAIRLAIEPSTA